MSWNVSRSPTSLPHWISTSPLFPWHTHFLTPPLYNAKQDTFLSTYPQSHKWRIPTWGGELGAIECFQQVSWPHTYHFQVFLLMAQSMLASAWERDYRYLLIIIEGWIEGHRRSALRINTHIVIVLVEEKHREREWGARRQKTPRHEPYHWRPFLAVTERRRTTPLNERTTTLYLYAFSATLLGIGNLQQHTSHYLQSHTAFSRAQHIHAFWE